MSIKWMNVGWTTADAVLSNPTKLLVYLALADFANDQGVCWPSRSTIAEKARTSERNVSRILGEFEEQGVIKRSFRYKESTLYRLLPTDEWGKKVSGDNLAPQPEMSDLPDSSPPSGVTDEAVSGDTGGTYNRQGTLTTSSGADVVKSLEVVDASTPPLVTKGLTQAHAWTPPQAAVDIIINNAQELDPDSYVDHYIVRCRELSKQPSGTELARWFLRDEQIARRDLRLAREKTAPPTDDMGVPKTWSMK